MNSEKELISGDEILNEEIDVRDFIENGATFSLPPKYENTADYEDEDLLDCPTGEMVWNDSELGVPGEYTFADIKLKMKSVDENGFVHKFLKKPGYGEKISEGSLVEMHYNGFWEGEQKPFDSTYLRENPKKFVTGRVDILPGLEQAVQTMVQGEQAQFIISHRLLFGETGCPPRIKPAADALFNIELLRVYDTYNITDCEPSDEKIPFQELYACAKSFHVNGVDAFKSYNLNSAVKNFNRAVNLLEKSRQSCEEEQEQQQKLLQKLFTNLAVCYNHKKLHKKACSMCNEVARITNVNNESKVLYQHGIALEGIGEYARAKDKLNKAYKLRPNDVNISNRLADLEVKIQKAKQYEVAMCTKMFNTQLKINKELAVSAAFRTEAANMIKDFYESDATETRLPPQLASEEIQCFKDIILNNEYHIVTQETRDNIVFLRKIV